MRDSRAFPPLPSPASSSNFLCPLAPVPAAATSALLEHKAFWLDCLPPPFLLSPLCIQRPSASSSRHDAYSPRKCHFKTLPFFSFTQTPFREPLAPKGGREGLKGGGEIKERRVEKERDFGEEALRDPLGLIANESPLSFSPPAKKLSMNRL